MNRAITILTISAVALLPLQAFSAPAATATKPATTTAATKTVAKPKGKKIDDMIAELKAKDKDKNGYITREEAREFRVAKKKETAAKKAAKAKQ